MNFHFPNYLWALFAILIPIALHLLSAHKPKKVYFSDTRLLQEIQQQHKKLKTVVHPILLVLRCLTIFFIVFAFAQAYFSSTAKKQQGYIIYLDNSESMGYYNGVTTLLAAQQKALIHRLATVESETPFYFINNNTQNVGNIINKPILIDRINETQITNNINSVSNIQYNIQEIIKKHPEVNWKIVWISDNQATNFRNFASFDGNNSLEIINVAPKNATNKSITSAKVLMLESKVKFVTEFATPPKKEEFKYQVQINDFAPNQFNHKANNQQDTIDIQLVDKQWNQIKIIINDEHLFFDDTFYIAANPQLSNQIGYLNTYINPYINAFAKSEGIQVQSIQSSEQIKQLQAIFVDVNHQTTAEQIKWMHNALQQGINVIINLQNVEIAQLNAILAQQLPFRIKNKQTGKFIANQLNINHQLVKEVITQTKSQPYYAQLKSYYEIDFLQAHIPIVSLGNGAPLLTQIPYLNGNIYLYTNDIIENDFAMQNLFAPISYNMITQNKNNQSNSYNINSQWSISKNKAVTGLFNSKHELVKNPSRSIGNHNTYLLEGLPYGFYYALDAQQDTQWIALNYYDKESDLKVVSNATLESIFKNASLKFSNNLNTLEFSDSNENSAFPMWKIAVLLTLLCFAGEIYYLLKK